MEDQLSPETAQLTQLDEELTLARLLTPIVCGCARPHYSLDGPTMGPPEESGRGRHVGPVSGWPDCPTAREAARAVLGQ